MADTSEMSPKLFSAQLEFQPFWFPNATSSVPHKIRERLRTKYSAKSVDVVGSEPLRVEARFTKLWQALDLWRDWILDDVLPLNGIKSVSLRDHHLLTPDPMSPDCLKDSTDVDEDDEDVSCEGKDAGASEAETSYFASYDRCSIHVTMIEDQTRTMAYKKAIMLNAHLFRGKVVLEVGSGTGILSLFAAQAGAQCVYAIEASGLSSLSQQAISDNGFADIITVYHGKMESVVLPQMADILISEWMGYGLLYENMLTSVLYARDKWLKPDGLMFPDKARLFITGYCGMDERTLEIYSRSNIDLSPLMDYAKRNLNCQYAKPQTVFGLRQLDRDGPENDEEDSAVCLREWDLKTCESSLCGTVDARVAFSGHGVLTGLVLYFEVVFSEGPEDIVLTTSPHCPRTHWAQVVLKLNTPFDVREAASVCCEVRVSSRPLRPRAMDVRVRLSVPDGQQEAIVQKYVMGK